LVVVGLTGCQTQTQEERPQPVESVQQAAFKDGGVTLADLQADPNLVALTPPSGYLPSKFGVWNYEACHLFQLSGTNLTVEAYTFSNSQDRQLAGSDCAFDWDSNLGGCNSSGNVCGIRESDGVTVCCD
jgi:hypothetical protein